MYDILSITIYYLSCQIHSSLLPNYRTISTYKVLELFSYIFHPILEVQDNPLLQVPTLQIDLLLDFIDFTWHFINGLKEETEIKYNDDYCQKIDDSLSELNYRFKQNNLGYEYINGELIRIDNKLLHGVVIKPALYLLNSEDFNGAEEEFRKAFEYRRKGDNKNAILEALKAFESTMKTICDKKEYTFDPNNDTAKNSFYPSYMNNHIANLRTTLESGLPVLRNKNAGHGQGATVVNVSDEFTEYALNLAATNIVLLVKIYQSQK
nr:hypothetical protein [Blautia pseudococcoides]